MSIFASDPDRALAAAVSAGEAADLVELRLDAMEVPDPAFFLSRLETPVLITCRPEWEGGCFRGSEVERRDILMAAIRDGAAYVDIELKTAVEMRQLLLAAAKEKGVKSIVSWHDFKTTASAKALESIFQEQCRTGADVGKIVTTARDFRDVLRVLGLQELSHETGFPLCAFCMGKAGVISRIATLEMGGFMSYAAADDGQPAAPGQLSVSVMRRIMEALADGRD
ncbi:MAG: type I 3-dehydroquinate dehydratase [Proteobacteria bacterium]|nr:type I 3-dehydroquinate dehydratase [Pseudomonadota bacterium]MBU1736976.1 type I 3-dehydroquinate dehydratase [Pseudomonadota bacterium]